MLCSFCQGYLNNGRSGISAFLQLNYISRLQFNSIAEFAELLHSLREVQLKSTRKRNTFIGINPGLGKIDCNRYSIAIFITLYSSNALEPLLF